MDATPAPPRPPLDAARSADRTRPSGRAEVLGLGILAVNAGLQLSDVLERLDGSPPLRWWKAAGAAFVVALAAWFAVRLRQRVRAAPPAAEPAGTVVLLLALFSVSLGLQLAGLAARLDAGRSLGWWAPVRAVIPLGLAVAAGVWLWRRLRGT